MKKELRLHQRVWNIPFGFTSPYQLYDAAKGHRPFIQKLNLQSKLAVHNGCVNTICWNDSGEYILSGSDDQRLCVTHGYKYTVETSVQTGHKANIFSARYLPNTGDKYVISCSGDGVIIHTNLDRPETSLSNVFACHFGTAYEILTVPNDPHTFLSCGEDGTVRWFDLRIKSSCNTEDCKEDVLINCHGAVTALAVCPFTPHHLGVGSSDGYVRIFDRRLLGTRATGNYSSGGMQAMITRFSVPEFEGRGRRITSLCYSPDGEEMLVSYSSDYVYLFEVKGNGRGESTKLETRFEKRGLKEGQGRCSNKSFLGRLRVTGDWSDTGPNARSQSEIRESGEQPQRSLHSNLMQRMCDVLTRMFSNSTQSATIQSPHPSENSQISETSTAESTQEQTGSSLSNNNSETSVRNSMEENDSVSSPVLSLKNQKKEQKLNKSYMEETDKRQEASSSVSEDESYSRDDEVTDDEEPRCYSLSQSVKSLRNELSSRRRNFLEKHNLEPVINLHYNGQGVTSGLITMGVSDVSEREQLNLHQNERNDFRNNESEGESSMSVHHNLSDGTTDERQLGENQQNPDIRLADSAEQQTHSSDITRQISSEQSSSQHDVDNIEQPIHDQNKWEHDDSSVEESNKEEIPREEGDEESEKQLKFCIKSKQMQVPEPQIKRKFTGHRNSRTMIKEATFWGNDFVMSGSDCGHIFIWDRYTSQLVMVLEADNHVVNCLQPHPFDPILASSGIDHDIKIWAPSQHEPVFDEKKAWEIVGRNQVMLEETKDTITVPASFMIRMLASLNNLRSAGGISGWRRLMREDRQSPSSEPE